MVLASLPGLKVNFKDKNKKENTKMDCFMGRPYSTTQKQDGLKGNTGKEKDMGKEFTFGEMEAGQEGIIRMESIMGRFL